MKFYSSDVCVDMKISTSDGKTIHCSKMYMAAKSGYFRGLLTSGTKDQSLTTDFAFNDLRLFVLFSYFESFMDMEEVVRSLESKRLQEMMRLCDFFLCDSLTKTFNDGLNQFSQQRSYEKL